MMYIIIGRFCFNELFQIKSILWNIFLYELHMKKSFINLSDLLSDIIIVNFRYIIMLMILIV